MKKDLLLILFMIHNTAAFATVRNVPSQYSSIQLALNSSLTADTVLVQPGTYAENIVWPAVYGLKLLSAGDSSNTIIDGNKTGRVITFNASALVDSNTLVMGFKITNGFISVSHAYGSGIYVNGCSPSFQNLDISNNHLSTPGWDWAYGAGVHLNGSQSVFKNCIIQSNAIDSASWTYGGGMYLDESTVKLTDVVIENNSVNSDSWCYGHGLYATYNSFVTMVNTVIRGNVSKSGATWYYGAGLYLNESDALLTNVLIVSNRMGTGGLNYKGSGIRMQDSSSVNIINSTISDNGKADNTTISEAIYVDDSKLEMANSIIWNGYVSNEIISVSSTIAVSYSCVKNGYPGLGNIMLNPLFASSSDFHLQNNSPCVDTANTAVAPTFDLEYQPRPMPFGGKPDMGCYELYQVSSLIADHEINGLSVFPNPVTSFLHIIQNNTGFYPDLIFKLYGSDGRMVMHIKPEILKDAIDVSMLSPGIYFLEMVSHNSVAQTKFVKQ